MLKCCGISKPDPLNPPHRGTLNVRTERPELLLPLFPHRGEIERGLVCFQQLLIKERIIILYLILFTIKKILITILLQISYFQNNTLKKLLN